MFSKITSKVTGIAVSGLFVLTMGLGVIGGGGGVVHAQDNDTGGLGETTTCIYAGVAYSVGSTVVMADNNLHTCKSDGSWSRIVTPGGGTKFNKVANADVLQRAQ